ncbi:MAG TPA: ATP-binding protein [Lachnospiraceae bacterium]|nr:ATP-binding protein [Lachnospiraceae bacterium]
MKKISWKHQLTVRLVGYFFLVFLVFSVIIGFTFFYFFRANTIELHRAELEQRAEKIAETLGAMSADGIGRKQGNGYGAYLKYLGDIAMSDVWLIDKDRTIITDGDSVNSHVSYTDLPEAAENMIDEVFSGETLYSSDFDSVLSVPVITVGTPVISSTGEITGALLLHSSVDHVDLAVRNAFLIFLLSITAAFLIGMILAVRLSRKFTKPVCILSDITTTMSKGEYGVRAGFDRKDEIGLLGNSIDILAQRLEELERQRQHLFSSVSHELRTPVTVVQGSLEALIDGVVSGEDQKKEYFYQMLAETKNLSGLIDDILELSRLQNQEFVLTKGECFINDIFSDLKRSLAVVAKRKGVGLVFEQECPAYGFYCDYNRIRQMFFVIYDNAIKYSDAGKTVTTTFQLIFGRLQVTVSDQGIGIGKEELPHLFERFFRSERTGDIAGSGLGLSIAAGIAKRHDIELSVTSEEGKGTAFSFLFPESGEKKSAAGGQKQHIV